MEPEPPDGWAAAGVDPRASAWPPATDRGDDVVVDDRSVTVGVAPAGVARPGGDLVGGAVVMTPDPDVGAVAGGVPSGPVAADGATPADGQPAGDVGAAGVGAVVVGAVVVVTVDGQMAA